MTDGQALETKIRGLAEARALDQLDWRVGDPGPCGWAGVHDLLLAAFSFMEGRIDPPSSLYAMTAAEIGRKANEEIAVIARETDRVVACGFFTPRRNALYLGKLAVSESLRRRGMLRLICDAAGWCAARSDLRWLELQTRIELTENHAAFRALGFEIVESTAHPGYDRATSFTMRRPVA